MPTGKKIEQYKCQSYYDDDNVLQECTCGKCSKWRGKIGDSEVYGVNIFLSTEKGGKWLQNQEALDFISQLLTAQKESFIKTIESMPDIARGEFDPEAISKSDLLAELEREVR